VELAVAQQAQLFGKEGRQQRMKSHLKELEQLLL
jgi:hypothetical protein